MWLGGIVPPSGSEPEVLVPVDSSMYASPSSVFSRRIACVSIGIGANCFLRSIATSELTPSGWTLVTLPTSTPEIRTSAPGTSWPVSGNRAWIR